MEMQTTWMDRGHSMELGSAARGDGLVTLFAASRGGSIAVNTAAATLWLVLRGGAEFECREGRFGLVAGDWISLERESCPLVYAAGNGLVLGIALPAVHPAMSSYGKSAAVFPGRGRFQARAAAFRAWRHAAPFVRNETRTGVSAPHASSQLLRFVAALQDDFGAMVHRCPGRSLRRKRQLFSRMQRACLHMEGHLGRITRISELAEMASMSVWYFTKTFHAIYGQSPQAASARIRLAHAADLLLDTRLSVSEVGAACGFENNCSFSRAFRARFGLPPSLYRLRGGSSIDRSGKATGHVQPSSVFTGSVTWASV